MKVFTPFWRAALALREPAPLRPRPKGHSGRGACRRLSYRDVAEGAEPPAHKAGLGRRPAGDLDAGRSRRPRQARYVPVQRDERLRRPSRSARPARHVSPLPAFAIRRNQPAPGLACRRSMPSLSGESGASAADLTKFRAEIGWREFSYHLLFSNPDLATRNYQPKFDSFPWRQDEVGLRAWQRGLTGYPLVDAGMRQLWRDRLDAQPGTHDNGVIPHQAPAGRLAGRTRHGSGTRWSMPIPPATPRAGNGWQARARMRLPITASSIRSCRARNSIPQAIMSAASCRSSRNCRPISSTSPGVRAPNVLAEAGVRLGVTYPCPIVDHDEARTRALSALQATKPSVV